MKATRKQFSPSRGEGAVIGRWVGLCRLVGRSREAFASRHARWTENILAHSRCSRSMRRRNLQTMIPVFGTRPSNQFFQRLHVKNYGAGPTAPMVSHSRLFDRTNQRNVFHTESRVEVIRGLRPILSPEVSLAARKSLTGTPRNDTHPRIGFAHASRLTLPQYFGTEPESANPARKRTRVLQQNPQTLAGELSVAAPMFVSKIGKKHRRIEAAPPPSMRAPRAVFASTRDSEEILAARAAGGSRRQRLEEPDHRYRAPGPNDAPFDATRMTDEILKQLDRRLVAAKERRGRI
jgi:hypothetical protein